MNCKQNQKINQVKESTLVVGIDIGSTMQSVIDISCKLIRVFYAVLTKGVAYDPQKMMSDIRRPAVA